MTTEQASIWPVLSGIALAAGLNVALAGARPVPALAWLHPVAPPLTHIPELGETVLAGDASALEAPSAAPPPPAPTHGAPPRPPLRGVAGALDRVLRAVGTPEQRAALDAARPDLNPLLQRSSALRLAVQADTIAIADALGPHRISAILDQKDALSTRYGEGRAWAAAAAAVSAPPVPSSGGATAPAP